MENNLIDGKQIALKREKELLKKFLNLKVKPRVVSILVGNDAPSVLYTNLKQKKAEEVGVSFEPVLFPETANFNQVLESIEIFNKDPKICGIMIQLPLPKEFLGYHETKELLYAIDPRKDIDGLNPHSDFLPAAVKAVLVIIEEENIEVDGKNVVVVGASDLVGKPVARELSKLGGEIKMLDRTTPDITEYLKEADMIVTAAGSPELIKGDMVKEGVVVIDVGAEKVGDKTVGDIEFESVAKKASKITPVPGGVGPVTVTCLMENILEAC